MGENPYRHIPRTIHAIAKRYSERVAMRRLILASASPRRRELLAQAGFTFEVRPAHVNEDLRPDEGPIAYVVRLARDKAQAVFNELLNLAAPGLDSETWETMSSDPRSLTVLGADTTVTLDGHILAKPEDAADAARMLRMLSGRTHRVITGVAVATASGTQVAAEVTGVQFLTLSDEEIDAYIATGEPMDKAGAYGIQGYAAKWIPRIEGCYFNVVGLPLALVTTMLEAIDAART
jgi:septum formation protein